MVWYLHRKENNVLFACTNIGLHDHERPKRRNHHQTYRQRLSHSGHEPWWLCCWSHKTADERRPLPPNRQRPHHQICWGNNKVACRNENVESRRPRDPKTTWHHSMWGQARFYLLPKIHKLGNPGCPTVLSCWAPTEKISHFVVYHLCSNVETLPSFTKDTTDFVSKLQSLNNIPRHPWCLIDIPTKKALTLA